MTINFKNQPSIILVNPQLGENIGMAARAMLNCGLTDLRIVNPRDGWPSDRANAASSGAFEWGVIPTLYKTTADAVADLHFTYATTARPRGMIKDIYTPHGAMSKTHEQLNIGQKIGILFGAERTGLENINIAQSNAIITVPLNSDFSSLNLSQAVLLIAYEFMIQSDKTPDVDMHTGKSNLANRESVMQFTNRLIELLENKDFFKSGERRPTIKRSLNNLFLRQNWTEQDVKTLHGILSALVKDNTI